MTIDELKYFLNVAEDDDSYDQVIESLYNLSKDLFYQYTRQRLSLSEFTDVFTNVETTKLTLFNYPVNEIIEVSAFSNFSSVNPIPTTVPEYSNYSGILYFDEPINAKIVKVIYKAGYQSIPDNIDQVLAQLVSFLWNYDATKVFISGNSEAVLRPSEMELPKHIKDTMAVFRIGL